MNFSKTVVLVAFSLFAAISCKDTASQPTGVNVEKKAAVALKPETASITITGMTCAVGCAKTIEKKLSKLEGVQKATVDFDKKEATVDFDASVLTSDKLVKTVESTGDGETYKVSDIKTKAKV